MRRLARQNRERIVARVEQYAALSSLANQVTALVGSEYLRMRVGDYRVIFKLEHGKTAVMAIMRVRHRRESYD